MIKPKEKTCKGIGKAHGFNGCGTKTMFRKYGLCLKKCYPKYLQEDERGKVIMYNAINKVQKPRKDFEKAEKKSKEDSKIKLALANLKTIVHAKVRERDEGKNCISCDAVWNSEFQAGHHYSANSFHTLKFNLDNINGQCVKCNIHLEGNFDNYALNLPKRIGQERYNELVKLAAIDKTFVKIWNIENLKEIKDKIKEFK